MSSRDWEKELAAIDRQLASIPDEALVPKPQAAPPATGARPQPVPAAARPAPGPVIVETPKRRWRAIVGLLVRLAIGLAAVAAVVLWPYDARCGAGLAGYLAVVAVIGLAGLWTSVAAWRHRAAFFHVLGLALMVTSGVFAAREVLPRVGYAMPTMEHPAIWVCR